MGCGSCGRKPGYDPYAAHRHPRRRMGTGSSQGVIKSQKRLAAEAAAPKVAKEVKANKKVVKQTLKAKKEAALAEAEAARAAKRAQRAKEKAVRVARRAALKAERSEAVKASQQ